MPICLHYASTTADADGGTAAADNEFDLTVTTVFGYSSREASAAAAYAVQLICPLYCSAATFVHASFETAPVRTKLRGEEVNTCLLLLLLRRLLCYAVAATNVVVDSSCSEDVGKCCCDLIMAATRKVVLIFMPGL